MAKTGRPRKQIDLELAEKLGAIMCTIDECSGVLEVNKNTLRTRDDFLEAWKRGKQKGCTALRRKQFQLAEKSAAMAIFLGKNFLGQTDAQEITHSGDALAATMRNLTGGADNESG